MSVKALKSGISSPLPLPSSLRKKLHYDKVKIISLAILTCGVSYMVRTLVRQFKVQQLNKVLLPATRIDPATITPVKDKDVVKAPIINHSGYKLDAMEFEVKPSSKNWLVYFCGNGMVYQDAFDEIKRIAKKTHANLLVFNYRGVGFSKGNPAGFTDLLVDGAACVQYLRKVKKVRQKNITLWGFSLGGAVATALCTFYKRIKLFNERSFGDSLKAIYYLLGKGLLGGLGVVIVVITASAVKVGGYWKKISSKQKLMAYHPLDGVIQKPASLYQWEKNRIKKKYPKDLVLKVAKFKLPKHRKPPCIKLDAGTNQIDRNNHVALDPKNEKMIVNGLKALISR